ncbi:MAG: hypothetical protein ACLFUY_11290, partial [Desulfobacterales bacterium]
IGIGIDFDPDPDPDTDPDYGAGPGKGLHETIEKALCLLVFEVSGDCDHSGMIMETHGRESG